MPHINRRFTDFSGLLVRSMSSPSSWCRWGMPSRSLPLPPRWGRALRPILVTSFILCFLEATQNRQRFFEVKWMPHRHHAKSHKIRTDPPIATIYVKFFFCGNMGVVFVRQSVHFKDDFFRATQLDHHLSEQHVTDKSIVNFSIASFDTSSEVDLSCGVLYHLLSSRTCDRVSGPSWCRSSG